MPRSSAAGAHDQAKSAAGTEIARLSLEWSSGRTPDLWFCYHPYYKAPDLIGPALSRQFGLPYVTAEASYSVRRNIGAWADSQALVAEAVRQAAVNICLTQTDRAGLVSHRAGRPLRNARSPSSTPAPIATRNRRWIRAGIVTVAMMRPGDKLESYRMLAPVARAIEHLPWTIAVVGDGPAGRGQAQFAGSPRPHRMAGRTAAGRRAGRSTAAGRSMSGRASARPTAWPISKPRPPDCRWWRRTSPACRRSSATARPAC